MVPTTNFSQLQQFEISTCGKDQINKENKLLFHNSPNYYNLINTKINLFATFRISPIIWPF